MKLFVHSVACTSGAHCVACRSREAGHSFRASLGKMYELPVTPTGTPPEDFECPKGKPWGWTATTFVPLPAAKPAPRIVVTRRPAQVAKKECGCNRRSSSSSTDRRG